MATGLSYKIFFISESAATIHFGNVVNEELNKKVVAIFNHITASRPAGIIEAIPAYSSVTVYYDVVRIQKMIPHRQKIYQWILEQLHTLMKNDFTVISDEKNIVRIPVCYEGEFAIDLEWMAAQKNILPDEMIRIHHSKQYRVYMLGFLPGFTYMGEVDEKIAIPRKPQPQAIPAGSVGIAGRQTGVYPLNSPGGWQIIGRTPLRIFDINKNDPCLVKAGDYVEFYPITANEFKNY